MGTGQRIWLLLRHERTAEWAPAEPAIKELRVRKMLEIVLGALVLLGSFLFCSDVTDAWRKLRRDRRREQKTRLQALFSRAPTQASCQMPCCIRRSGAARRRSAL